MAAGRLLLPGWMPAVDSNGDPIPNAKVYFYFNKTSTLAPVYSDESLTVRIANPVEANATGRFPAVWADGEVLYSASVEAPYGPAGVPFTYDNLSASLAAEIILTETAETAANDAETAYQNILDAIQAAQDADGVASLAGAIAGQAAANAALTGKADIDGANVNASPFLAAIGGVRTDGFGVNATPFREALGVNATSFFGNPVPTQGSSASIIYKSEYEPAVTPESMGGLHPNGNAYYRYSFCSDFNATNAPTPAASPAATHMVIATNSGSGCDVMAQMSIALARENSVKVLGLNTIVGSPVAQTGLKLEGHEIDIQPAIGSTVVDGFGLALNAFNVAMPISAVLIGGVGGGSFGNGINFIGGISDSGVVATNNAAMDALINSGSGVYSDDAVLLSNGHAVRFMGTTSGDHARVYVDSSNNLRYVAPASNNQIFRDHGDVTSLVAITPNGIDIQVAGGFLSVAGNKVVGARQAAIPNAASGTEVATINAILAVMRTHGLIAT